MTKMIMKAQEESDMKSKGMNIELQRLIHSKASAADLYLYLSYYLIDQF